MAAREYRGLLRNSADACAAAMACLLPQLGLASAAQFSSDVRRNHQMRPISPAADIFENDIAS